MKKISRGHLPCSINKIMVIPFGLNNDISGSLVGLLLEVIWGPSMILFKNITEWLRMALI
jgi:hypothetical protein